MSNIELILIGKFLNILKLATYPKKGVTLSEQALKAPNQDV
jgi:hypothetical protein